ncbi:hypothetical protein Hanom_Chr13g01244221 [Helianthus anomalus]
MIGLQMGRMLQTGQYAVIWSPMMEVKKQCKAFYPRHHHEWVIPTSFISMFLQLFSKLYLVVFLASKVVL